MPAVGGYSNSRIPRERTVAPEDTALLSLWPRADMRQCAQLALEWHRQLPTRELTICRYRQAGQWWYPSIAMKSPSPRHRRPPSLLPSATRRIFLSKKNPTNSAATAERRTPEW
ncbi:uncharacterized protein FPRO_15897 [Fusarium proliferatum ET1]|uniref:Uncharacterized protein n=1 Tax=Fusarium proliferatum (strain ET1) TaxID=1227346 RepID=A0A1L7WAA0_FUSPR|nr:uncharacterized protein FPRO_15897 [Fusarium proliferatum ET1]CZR49538.1 uncharacterized protein FPRO_15897 [Fusarium proliferatum ET1]